MKNIWFAICIVILTYANSAYGSNAGMPQLNTEFWISQIFWLTLIFIGLYAVIWKVFLPKITNSIENRKSRVVNDLNETQKLKENAEKKLIEYNKIIEETKKEAKQIIEESKKKLEDDIKNKRKKLNEEIERELMVVEKEIKDLKKSSISNINKISIEISSEVIKKIVGMDTNTSNVAAIVEDVIKKEGKYINEH